MHLIHAGRPASTKVTDAMFAKVLIANRGVIATRIIRTLAQLQIKSLAVFHEQDRHSLHVQQADEAVSLGNGSMADSYLNIAKLIDIAKQQGAEAIHPGYGFLSENIDFVRACEQAGIVFIGPTSTQIEQFGLKHEARQLAKQAQVPLLPGTELLTDLPQAIAAAQTIGYPVMLKSTAGGGGIGMQVCHDESELQSAWDTVRRLGKNYFANAGVFLEKYIAQARHIEVQIFGDGQGTAVSLGERDCSAQRRNQKVIEETPAPNLTSVQRQQLHEVAERLMASVHYRNTGTVEFVFDALNGEFYFLEVNTRLQVEHGVTEEVWGVDLVAWMVQQAAGELADLHARKAALSPSGHALQMRLYAENPAKDFQPCAGLLSDVRWSQAEGVRIDTWVETGLEVPALFDPLLAKVIAKAPDRSRALALLSETLAQISIYGIETNQFYGIEVLASPAAQQGQLQTRSLNQFHFQPVTVDVLSGGAQTSLQDLPGRTGYWDIGVPPSGPMDTVNFQLSNYLVGNSADAVALEILQVGPTLRFNCTVQLALCGAEFTVTLDNQPVPLYQTLTVNAGQTLAIGRVGAAGARLYLAVAGGFCCPAYLGSKSTFTLGQFGGHAGRALRTGDVLRLNEVALRPVRAIAEADRPVLEQHTELRVIYGPHGAPDFFTEQDVTQFFAHDWQVHYNSSRTGIRLLGPKPEWARDSGGEAGMHPSNIHDNAYAFGTVDFTGDMPVILGPDGPSLGGFVCPATVISADLWKLGQLKAGQTVRFCPVSYDNAQALAAEQARMLATGIYRAQPALPEPLNSPVILQRDWLGDAVSLRIAGDCFVLLEVGPAQIDIAIRLKVHALMLALQQAQPKGVAELTPGIRSLQIHYHSQQLPLAELVHWLNDALDNFTIENDLVVPSRTVYLPLSWDDEACREAIEKYQQSVRPDAPWCPSNIEFIRRINGLSDIEQVQQTVLAARYLVLGLGDVYLGAPVATPIDPRHRLVTTKYNPARTWTAENSVGIGGAYLCVYGMEGPGGYQFVGRTSQMWNRYRTTPDFQQPWLLRCFDQLRFYLVSPEELARIRADLPMGKHRLRIEQSEFRLSDYQAFIADNEDAIAAFEAQRSAAFAEELARWRANGQLTFTAQEQTAAAPVDEAVPDSVELIESPVAGSVWQVLVQPGQSVAAGSVLIILESMKMEIEVTAMRAGSVAKLFATAGQAVVAGQTLGWLTES